MGSRRSGPTPASGKGSGSAGTSTKGKGKSASNMASTSTGHSGFTLEEIALYKAMRSKLEGRKKDDEGMLSNLN